MLELKFGVRVDMTSMDEFIDDMSDLVGEVDDIEEQESDKIVWDTDTNLVVTIRGDFDTSGVGEAERIEIHTQDHDLVMSAFDFNDNTDSADLIDEDGIEFVLNQIDEGAFITGSVFNDSLCGGDSADILSGGAGADVLNGRGGIDELKGGAGNDTYVIDGGGEINKSTSDPGVDMVRTPLSYTLGAQQENLTLLGTAALNATGNTKPNIMWGNDSANTLTGAAGSDTLHGRSGGDSLRGQEGNDTLDGAAGDDTLLGSSGEDVANGAAGADTLDGGDGKDNLSGGAGNDNVAGGTGSDVLKGQDGVDTLNGGIGADELTGGNGSDVFRFSTSLANDYYDTIMDFSGAGPANSDVIELENSIFKELAAGDLSAAAFQAGDTDAAESAGIRIIYNRETGVLFYDADGSGEGNAIRFAALSTSPDTLGAEDFVVT